ncbi:ComF family protein [Sulfurovum sp. zt1-1]|uniref:ComF family protein n=1 Tax=Sulfurovum zhangzhouensis TaxID=3019067 RepID=A0ABT7QXV9_9BACT|nr:ComF family protein [Sulfurovum zhangzhouensis]MDM5271667.1 ComF family protein [Sulfurovum zhangzhouensis]
MRCYTCSKLSFQIICSECQVKLFRPQVHTRKIGTLDVISFYPYSTIESLLHTKHKAEGYRIYKKLGKMTMEPFIKEFAESLDKDVHILGIDEHVGSGYSHIALLTKELQTKYTKVMHGKLLTQNRVSYSGRDLQFRLNHPREFRYGGKTNIDVILIDDTITTGITLQEAQSVLMRHGVNVLFALTLADAKE